MLILRYNESYTQVSRQYLLAHLLLMVAQLSLSAQIQWIQPDYSQVSEDVSVRIRVLANDNLFESRIDSNTLKVVQQAHHGVAVAERSTAAIRYRPNPNFFGLDSFTYEACNAQNLCQEASVQVLVHSINDAPVAQNDLDTVNEDSWIILDVIENDGDLADNMIMEDTPIEIIEMPRQGVLSVEREGLKYRPNPNYYGNDYLRYSICDESLCDTAMVRIHVRSINDPPKIKDDFVSTIQGLLVVMDPLVNDDDSLDLAILDRETLTTENTLLPKHGFTYLDPEVGLIVYVPNVDFVGIDSFRYQVCDTGPAPILCDSATVVVQVSAPGVDDENLLIASSLFQSSPMIISHKESPGIIHLKNEVRQKLPLYLTEYPLVPGQYQYTLSNGALKLTPLQGS